MHYRCLEQTQLRISKYSEACADRGQDVPAVEVTFNVGECASFWASSGLKGYFYKTEALSGCSGQGGPGDGNDDDDDDDASAGNDSGSIGGDTQVEDTEETPGSSSTSSSCFGRESAAACRLLTGGASAAAAYSACWGAAGSSVAGATAAAVLVPMSELVAGDLVLTEKGVVVDVDRVVVNQHRAASAAGSAALLTLVHAAGSLTHSTGIGRVG